MPYTTKKNENGEYCVHKMAPNMEPMGDSMGCFATLQEAMAHIDDMKKSEGMPMKKDMNK